ncbi:mannose-6-phosphate isomerase, class I [Vibrio sp. SCSIO 43137]|uniref:mannose-6-phosphate isomerase, class I n=1 Tax=Vibrio sp. SCSIO 43137 TaxID=3021011 RepID=UPI0023070389|nr:mannose-6-phosphate isomerase, class I [Vibrio sp. SCSIO 43137]WCE31544.1 mannose-6-phosphate isomerase, class I [Vibrio sp. SCSIO 43137]
MSQENHQFFFPMKNVIQDYAWGSTTSINQLFAIENPHGKPQAEIWMGAHPNGCSTIVENGEEQLLSDFINLDKSGILTVETDTQFGELPYLFKVLAAEQALSIQVHPSKEQAEIGFQKEEQAGIARNAANRNYKDPNHKPELVYALTAYQAMNGFRQFSDILALFQQVNVPSLTDIVEAFANQTDEQGLEVFFASILSLKGGDKDSAVSHLLDYAEENNSDALFTLILELSGQYPGDIGLFCPLMLNVLTLQPGEAMFLDACTPHAYIKGTGLEIMANSDNVLRSGLTPKYMDVEELVACTRFAVKPESELLNTPQQKDGGLYYPVPVEDFKFAVFDSIENLPLTMASAEILLPLDSDLTVSHHSGESVTVKKGQSLFIPAYAGKYQITSQGRVARAFN